MVCECGAKYAGFFGCCLPRREPLRWWLENSGYELEEGWGSGTWSVLVRVSRRVAKKAGAKHGFPVGTVYKEWKFHCIDDVSGKRWWFYEFKEVGS